MPQRDLADLLTRHRKRLPAYACPWELDRRTAYCTRGVRPMAPANDRRTTPMTRELGRLITQPVYVNCGASLISKANPPVVVTFSGHFSRAMAGLWDLIMPPSVPR